jgi:hypothetical protein
MSRQGREIALKYGQQLPAFESLVEAEQYYRALRERHLALLVEIPAEQPSFIPNYSPESLKQLEKLYFQLYDTDSFASVGTDRETFEICMAMYFGETAVRCAHAQWIVEPYFLAPDRYQLGVRKGLFTMMLTRFTDHFREPDNKRHESLFRRYKKCFR